MATATSNLVHDNSSLANFKAWAQFLFDGFNSVAGWTQTTDTGQTAPSAAGSVGTYYFLFKMADALQASCPVFVRVAYGTSGTSVGFSVNVGQGSDGSGNLTGATTAAFGSPFSTNEGATTFPCYVSGDAGSIRFMMWQSNSINCCTVFVIERSKDSSGASTASYASLLFGQAQTSNTGSFAFVSLLAGNPNPTPNYASVGGNQSGWPSQGVPVSLSYNGNVAAVPIVPLVGYPDNPMLDACCAYSGDVTEGAIVTVSIYGSNHSYIASKQGTLSHPAGGTADVYNAILMRYE
jgi:hypothetical protein